MEFKECITNAKRINTLTKMLNINLWIGYLTIFSCFFIGSLGPNYVVGAILVGMCWIGITFIIYSFLLEDFKIDENKFREYIVATARRLDAEMKDTEN